MKPFQLALRPAHVTGEEFDRILESYRRGKASEERGEGTTVSWEELKRRLCPKETEGQVD